MVGGLWMLRNRQVRGWKGHRQVNPGGFPTNFTCCQHLNRTQPWHMLTQTKNKKQKIPSLRQMSLSDLLSAFTGSYLTNLLTIYSFTNLFFQQKLMEVNVRHCSEGWECEQSESPAFMELTFLLRCK